MSDNALQSAKKKSAFLDEGEANPNAWCGLLHPEGLRRKVYDVTQMLLLMWTLYTVPIRIAFAIQPTTAEATFWIDVGVDSFFMLDLFVQIDVTLTFQFLSGNSPEISLYKLGKSSRRLASFTRQPLGGLWELS